MGPVLRSARILEMLSDLHTLIGDRKTYVQAFPSTFAASIGFMADLKPAPEVMDKDMFAINTKLKEESIAYFQKHVAQCDAVIATDLAAPEVLIFRAVHPNVSIVGRSIGGQPFYVLLTGTDTVTIPLAQISPTVHIESPAPESAVMGTVTVSGWAVTGRAVPIWASPLH